MNTKGYCPPVVTRGSSIRARGIRLLPLRGVMSLIDRSEDQVLALIESGGLLWAWNIGLKAERTAREIRVLPGCVDDFNAGRDCQIEWADVLKFILPHDGRLLSVTEITRCFNASSTHVY